MSKPYVIAVSLVLALIAGSCVLFFIDSIPPVVQFLVKLVILFIVIGPVAYWSLIKLCGPQRTKAVIVAFLFLGASTGASLFVAEIVVRHVFRNVTTTPSWSYFTREWQQEHARVTNRWGFREREFTAERPANTFRIAVVGDSFTYGQGIPVDERLTNILELRFNKLSDRNYEVLNFGWPATETIDHLALLKEVVLDVSPDYVLLQWFINDVEGHDASGRPKPWQLLPSDFLAGVLRGNSALYYLVDKEWRSFQQKLGLVESYEEYMVKRFRDSNGADSRAANEALEQFFLASLENGVPVGAVLFPQLVESAASIEHYPLGFLIDRVSKTCVQYKIVCLDLRPTFATVKPATRLWVNRLDSHPGRLANELAADAVLKKFRSEWLGSD